MHTFKEDCRLFLCLASCLATEMFEAVMGDIAALIAGAGHARE